MDGNVNRVYVNPNFSRVSNKTLHTSNPMCSNNHFYINPNFTCNMNNVHQITKLNRKIYVNPNFIKTNILESNNMTKCVPEIKNPDTSSVCSYSANNGPSNPIQCKIEKSKILRNISVRPSSKSRYHLVRKNDLKIFETQRQGKETYTIKINKYKSIPFQNYKNNLQIVQNENKQIPFKPNTNGLVSQYVKRNCANLVKNNLKSTTNTSLKLTPKSLKIKRTSDVKFQLKLKAFDGIRKINNIPCRLFTKYGKCLRNMYGTCQYLHDKKHVSLCRKFIKGICHDKQCLLSHELSSKKMPTCFFYLKGMCTKDDCPYLHVKLSEKSKICHDFQKGYCVKGDMCLHRHVLQLTDEHNARKLYTLNKHISKSIKLDISKSIKTNQLKCLPERKNIKTKSENPYQNEQNEVLEDSDCRYFKDFPNKESMCEVLKPTRCKLGALPSFIRLK